MIPFLGDEGLNHKNKYGNTHRDIARIHGSGNRLRSYR